jgi:LSD1 subclass zinc finger protein
MKRILPLLLGLLVLPALAAAPKTLLLAHSGLIDGTGSPVRRDMTIEIHGKRIAAVYPSGSKVPRCATCAEVT